MRTLRPAGRADSLICYVLSEESPAASRAESSAALQPLREQTRALAVMPNDLDQVAAAAPKNVEVPSVPITPQALLNQTRKARESAAHIGMAGRKPHPYITRYGNHRRSSTRMRRRLPKIDLDHSVPGGR